LYELAGFRSRKYKYKIHVRSLSLMKQQEAFQKHLLVLVRHGQSTYNLDNRFTGWADCDLSEQGKKEAEIIGQELKDYHIHFDQAYCSALKRTSQTFYIIADTVKDGFAQIQMNQEIALNERNYGVLQGENKEEAIKKYGLKQVETWRRGYAVAPPGGESLKQTKERVLQFYHQNIEPLVKLGKNVLITAHGNTLRALIMYLENINPSDIRKLEIATGQINLYQFDGNMKILHHEIKRPLLPTDLKINY